MKFFMNPTSPNLLLRLLGGLGGLLLCTGAGAQEKITYNDHIRPIFRQHCFTCHDTDGRSADLALDNYRDAIAGGASGEVVASGDAGESRLWQLMAHLDEPIMPPSGDKIPEGQLKRVKAWIDGGLLENSGSKAMERKISAVASFVPSADNHPTGDPAMPGRFFREPVVHSQQMGTVAEVAASPWAPVIAVAGQRQVLLYHSDTYQLLGVVPFVVGTPEVIRFSRNGDLLLVAGGRGAALGVVHLWDLKAGRRIAELGDEIDTILAADLRADHSLVALGGPRKRVKVLRTADGSVAYEITKHTDWVTALEFSPDGKTLVTGDRSGGVHLWEAATGRPIATLAGHKGPITSVSWRGDSQVVATASDDRTVHLWKTDGTTIRQWEAHGGGVLDVSFNKAGQLVTSGRDKTAKLWESNGQQVRQITAMDDLALSIITTHDDTHAVVSDWRGEVRVVATDSGKEAAKLTPNPPTLEMRLKAAERESKRIETQIGPAENAIAGASNAVDAAVKQIAAHRALEKACQQTLAQLREILGQCMAELKTDQAALATAEQSIAVRVEERQPIESELKALESQFAAVSNQQGEDAEATETDPLKAAVAASKEKLAAADAKLQTAQAAKTPLQQAKSTAEAAASMASTKVSQQEKLLAELENQAAQLPSVEKLTTQRELLQSELARIVAAYQRKATQIEVIQAEQATFRAAEDQWTEQIAKHQVEIRDQSAQLARLSGRLAKEKASAEAVLTQIADLAKRLSELKKTDQQLADIAGKTGASVREMADALAALEAERSEIERLLTDRKTAQALRNPKPKGD